MAQQFETIHRKIVHYFRWKKKKETAEEAVHTAAKITELLSRFGGHRQSLYF